MGIDVPTKAVGILVVSAISTKVVGMQASNQIQKLQAGIELGLNQAETVSLELPN